jgi:hypothetical protein
MYSVREPGGSPDSVYALKTDKDQDRGVPEVSRMDGWSDSRSVENEAVNTSTEKTSKDTQAVYDLLWYVLRN